MTYHSRLILLVKQLLDQPWLLGKLAQHSLSGKQPSTKAQLRRMSSRRLGSIRIGNSAIDSLKRVTITALAQCPRSDCQGIAGHELEHIAPLCSERHANSKFLCPLVSRERSTPYKPTDAIVNASIPNTPSSEASQRACQRDLSIWSDTASTS